MKKYIKPAILFLGSFIVVNAAMFGFLTLTRPSPPAEITAELAAADSTAVDSTAAEHAAVVDADAATRADSGNVALDSSVSTETASTLPETLLPMAEPAPEPAVAVAETAAVVPAIHAAPDAAPTAPVDVAAAVNSATLPDDSEELAKLAKLLESMKPDDAAAIVARLNTDQIIALVMRMKNRNGGKMLAALPDEKAASVAARMSQTASRGKSGS